MKKYICTVCQWVYNPEYGDPDGGIVPGTSFEELPDRYGWVCPICGEGKEMFEEITAPEPIETQHRENLSHN